MAEIRHLENRHDVIFFCWVWSGLDKISQIGAEWHIDCGNMVKIETRCRIPIWRTFARIPWHVIPKPRITLQGAATWWIHCCDSRASVIITCTNILLFLEICLFLLIDLMFGDIVSMAVSWIVFEIKRDYIEKLHTVYLKLYKPKL